VETTMDQPGFTDDLKADPFAPIGWLGQVAALTQDSHYKLQPFPLRFIDPQVERRFVQAYRRSTISFRRLAIAIGILAFAGFAPVDRLTNPETWPQLWWVRFGVAVPVLVITLGLGFWKKAENYYGYLINLALTIACLCLVVLMHFSTLSGVAQYYEALVLLLPVAFGFLRLRLAGAISIAIVASAAFGVETFWFRPLPPGQLAYSVGYLLAACLVSVALVYLMERQARTAFVLAASLDEASLRDPLTGVYNRRWLQVSLDQLVHTFRRYGSPFSLVLLDLDGFKSVNDELGYKAGDDALCRFAQAISGQIRAADTIFRYGGDEFVILCPSTPSSAVRTLLERLLKLVENLDLTDSGRSKNLSFSAGMAEILDPSESPDGLFARANRALLAAKRAGKGRAVLAEDLPTAIEPTQA
jgi:diguanylate cyclase (GGDEF)-like protein